MNYVYPGHPLTIALFILRKYGENLDRAFLPTKYGWPEALSDIDIPGAGDAVHSALGILGKIRDGRLTANEAIEEADRIWVRVRTCGGGYEDRLDPGRKEAEEIAPEFVLLAQGIRKSA